MKKFFVFTAAVLILAASAGAQVSFPLKVYAGGGITKPSSPDEFKDAYKTGYHLMGGVGLPVFPLIEAVGKLERHTFSNDIGQLEEGKFSVTMYGVDAKITANVPTFPIKPYAFVGIGLARVEVDTFELPGGVVPGELQDAVNALTLDSQTKFYYNLGAGVEWKLMPTISLFAQGRMINISTSQDASIEVIEPAFDSDTKLWAFSAGIKLF